MNIKSRIAFYKVLNKNIDNKFKSKYIEFYHLSNTGEILILVLKPCLQIENGVIEEYIKAVIEPITGEVIHSFEERKYLGALDERGNMSFVKGDDIYTVLDIKKILKNYTIPETIDTKYIYSLYELIERIMAINGKKDKVKNYSKNFK